MGRGALANYWQLICAPVGTYATDYLKRALIESMGLGANLMENTVDPAALTDADGQPF